MLGFFNISISSLTWYAIFGLFLCVVFVCLLVFGFVFVVLCRRANAMKILTILPHVFNTFHRLLFSRSFKLCLINESSKLEKRHEEHSHYFCISSKKQVTVLTLSYQEVEKPWHQVPIFLVQHVRALRCNIWQEATGMLLCSPHSSQKKFLPQLTLGQWTPGAFSSTAWHIIHMQS